MVVFFINPCESYPFCFLHPHCQVSFFYRSLHNFYFYIKKMLKYTFFILFCNVTTFYNWIVPFIHSQLTKNFICFQTSTTQTPILPPCYISSFFIHNSSKITCSASFYTFDFFSHFRFLPL